MERMNKRKIEKFVFCLGGVFLCVVLFFSSFPHLGFWVCSLIGRFFRGFVLDAFMVWFLFFLSFNFSCMGGEPAHGS